MRRWWIDLLGIVALAMTHAVLAQPALAQNPKTPPARQQTREIQGKVVRTAPDQFIVRTRDNKEVTFYINPQTKYLADKKAARYADLRAGSNITIGYATEGDRYIANNVILVPEPAGTAVVEPVTPAQPGAPAVGTVVQGTVLRVIGQDQVVIRTPDGKEVIVYVTPQTTYQLSDQGGAFTDVRPGVDIGVNYDTRDRRFMARRIYRRNR